MSPSFDVLCFGELLFDISVEWTELAATLTPGGAPANVAVAAANAGLSAALVAAIGDDRAGGILRSRLAQAGVNVDYVQTVGSSSTSLAITDGTVDTTTSFLFKRDADLKVSTDDLTGVEAKCVVFGSLSLTDQATAVQLAHLLEVVRPPWAVFDLNYRSSLWASDDSIRSVAERWLASANLLKTNERESEVLSDHQFGTLGARANAIRDGRHQIVLITAGPQGCAYSAPCASGFVAQPLLPEGQYIDKIGAGDTFIGCLAADLIRLGGQLYADTTALESSIATALDAAARSTRRRGAGW